MKLILFLYVLFSVSEAQAAGPVSPSIHSRPVGPIEIPTGGPVEDAVIRVQISPNVDACYQVLRSYGFRQRHTYEIICGNATSFTASCIETLITKDPSFKRNDSLSYICGEATKWTNACTKYISDEKKLGRADSMSAYCALADEKTIPCLASRAPVAKFSIDAAFQCSTPSLHRFKRLEAIWQNFN